MLNVVRLVLHDFNKGVKPIVGYIALTCALILPADFSTAAMLAVICFLMMIIAGAIPTFCAKDDCVIKNPR